MGRHWFISYARADGSGFAQQVYDRLTGGGIACWLDSSERGIRPGAVWDETIDQALRDSSGLLFVMTPGSVISQVCGDEISRALSFKLPVIPLKFHEVEPPFRVARRQWIDFTPGFETGIARLRDYLRWVESPEGDLQTHRDRLSDMQRDLERDPDNPRLQKAVRELEETIAYKARALAEPDVVQAENRRALEVGIEAEIQRQAQDRRHAREMARLRVVGSAPQGISEFFKDRVRQAAEINNMLLGPSDHRAVSVYGKGGVGKTALVCKVLQDLEKDYEHVFGVIYASARPGLDISLEQLTLSSAAMFGGETGERLLAAWKSPQTDIPAKIRTLLDAYAADIPAGQRVILLLDNLEEKLDAQGCLTDPDLKRFADMFLEARHNARLLITSREPLCLANAARRYEHIFPLDEGLPEREALELLADFDPRGEIGLRSADPDDLSDVVRRTLGFPRALEAVAGILDSDPLLTLRDLLADRDLWAREVTESLVRAAQSRLDADTLLIMQALAVYGEPVTEAAVRFLLEPLVQDRGLDLPAAIRRLARGRYVTAQRSTGHLVLHPLDKEANYRQIPRDETLVIHVVLLETRAADYFVELRTPREDWKTIDDLHPQLAEFEHRVRAGEYQAAAYLIGTIDWEYLQLWGHARKVVELRELLRGRLDYPALEGLNFNRLGLAYENLADYRKALTCYEEDLRLTRERENRWGEGVALGCIGTAYWYLGEYERAIEYQQQALEIDRIVGNRQGEGIRIHVLALNYSALGQQRRAIELWEESLAISREIGNRRGEPATLANLGDAYRDLGQLAEAQNFYQQAVEMFCALGDRPNWGIDLGKLGFSYLLQGDTRQADSYLRQALEIAREVGDRRWERSHLLNLARLALATEDITAAREHIRQAVTLADQLGNPDSFVRAYFTLAEIRLHIGDLPGAREAIRVARQNERPEGRDLNAVLEGIILARLGQQNAARAAFDEALRYTDDLLADTAELYGPKYSRGLALAGLALLGDTPAESLAQAADAFRAARANCDAAGVLDMNRRRLGYLAPLDVQGVLAGLREILA